MAAFYDMDGTLLHGSVVDHYLYFARNEPSYPKRALRMLDMLAKAPYYKYLDSLDRYMFNESFYKAYADLSEDRLAVLGEQLFESVLHTKLYAGVQELLEADRAYGYKQVLITGALDFVAKPVARHLGIETCIATRLEFEKNGRCTGVLKPPVMAGPAKAAWIRDYAREHEIDLSLSVAYADDAADLPMLSSVGRPVAVNPDTRLLATARSHGWPVLYVDAGGRTFGGKLAARARRWAAKTARALRDEAILRRPQAEHRVRGVVNRLHTLAANARREDSEQ
ncbi:MAG: HAD-IB family hydrolase [Planctomycetes bacterium]|nr:HAD-IB family hydrolase [Planctomycetota bacterium]